MTREPMFPKENYVSRIARKPMWKPLKMPFLYLGIKQPNFLLSFKSSSRTMRCTLPRVLLLS